MPSMVPPVIPQAGLCASCRHAREVVSGKGSRFVLCELSRTDRRFPRYPQLPVLACTGYEPADGPGPGRTVEPGRA
jgi:hypothetical protein